MAVRSPYSGPRRKLLLAFDVGTTFSGISYSILDPGRVPEIKGVTRFPAHEHISGASKIPTLIYYDRKGKVRAVGAEAMTEGILEAAEEDNWIKAEWFKLHLRSKIGSEKDITKDIPPLPLNKTVVQVLSDFLKYLLSCAEEYIKDTHANGSDLWNSVKDQIDFVLSHPNGWEGTQQAEMRKAAILAGLVPDNSAGRGRLTFVTEGEASLHFSVQNGLPPDALRKGDGIVIIDAGGGTIDINSYRKEIKGLKETFEEIAVPQCHFHGSVFISVHARLFLQNFLSGSNFADDIDHISRCFDKTTKLRFRNSEEPQYIKFGGTRDNDVSRNIRFGQLKLLGSDVALFFQSSVDCVVSAVLDIQKTAKQKKQNITHVVVVGGFAASEWLLSQVQKQLSSSGLNIIRPENHVNKAVSDGAISFFLSHFVRTRISKFAYGVFVTIPFRPNLADHRQRSGNTYISGDGVKFIRNKHFQMILPKNTHVTETKEFKCPIFNQLPDRSAIITLDCTIWCYRGSMVPTPQWQDMDPQNFTKLCNVRADFSQVPIILIKGVDGRNYYRVNYSIILLLGLTELKAQAEWEENGVMKRSPAEIVYDPDD